MNGPSFGSDLQPAAGGTGTAPRASRAETKVLQERAAQQPEPSMKLELSAELEELIRIEKTRSDESAARMLVGGDGSTPQGGSVDAIDSDLQKPGVQSVGAVAQGDIQADAAKKAESPEAIAKYMATGQTPGPNQPSASAESAVKDWTTQPKAEEVKPPEPPKEPISKKLLEFLQSLWRAGGNAIDVAQNGNQLLNPPKEADGPLTYADPAAKKTTGV